MTKVIIVSWLVGVVCGFGFILVLQSQDRLSPSTTATTQTIPQTSGGAPNGDTDKK
jgi:hypothetical protein